ncbi:MAG TPA: galactokinase family protein [Vicinamibacterales bacterium]
MRLFVPGRLEVFGKHTDYAGGHSLVAALPRGITVTAACTDDGKVAVPPSPYAETVVRRLKANFPDAVLSCRIAWSSDLPQAAGMSSSSALVIAIAESIVACARLEQTEAWRANIRTLEDRASYFACIENGSPFGTLAGNPGVGTHGGSEDHAAIVMSRAGHLGLFSFAPLRCGRFVPMPEGWTFVVAWSGVRAEKTGAVREAYNRLADPGAMTGARLQHFEAEDARVLEAADAFARGDIARIGELAAASQRDADALLENQVPETRDLVALALDAGADAASSFGAGWGGSVWALVPADGAESFAAAWLAAYQARHPDLPAGAFVSPPEKGTGLISPSEDPRN